MTNTRNERRGGTAVLVAATITVGLSAPARSDDRTYVVVMRNINTVIRNPVFFLSFMGALLLTALAGWRLRGSAGTGAPASLRGAGVHVPGVAGVRP